MKRSQRYVLRYLASAGAAMGDMHFNDSCPTSLVRTLRQLSPCAAMCRRSLPILSHSLPDFGEGSSNFWTALTSRQRSAVVAELTSSVVTVACKGQLLWTLTGEGGNRRPPSLQRWHT